MQTWKIDFEGMDGTRKVRGAIEERIAELDESVETCGVVVKNPQTGKRKGLYEIEIGLTLSDGRDLKIGRSRSADKRYEDINFAIDDTFRRARRRLKETVRDSSGKGKKDKQRRKSAPAAPEPAPAVPVAASQPAPSAPTETAEPTPITTENNKGKKGKKRRKAALVEVVEPLPPAAADHPAELGAPVSEPTAVATTEPAAEPEPAPIEPAEAASEPEPAEAAPEPTIDAELAPVAAGNEAVAEPAAAEATAEPEALSPADDSAEPAPAAEPEAELPVPAEPAQAAPEPAESAAEPEPFERAAESTLAGAMSEPAAEPATEEAELERTPEPAAVEMTAAPEAANSEAAKPEAAKPEAEAHLSAKPSQATNFSPFFVALAVGTALTAAATLNASAAWARLLKDVGKSKCKPEGCGNGETQTAGGDRPGKGD